MTATCGDASDDVTAASHRNVFLLDSSDPTGVTINSLLVQRGLAASTCDVMDDVATEKGDFVYVAIGDTYM